MEFHRPTWDNYFINIAKLTSERSNCIKRSVGCIIVKEKRILSLGYNGTPINTVNCYQGGCKRCMDQYNKTETSGKNLDLCMCLHAEENAILFVSKTHPPQRQKSSDPESNKRKNNSHPESREAKSNEYWLGNEFKNGEKKLSDF